MMDGRGTKGQIYMAWVHSGLGTAPYPYANQSIKNPYCDFTTDIVGWVCFLNVPLSNEIFTLALNFRSRKQNIPTVLIYAYTYSAFGKSLCA
jgi:hypothetical protein